MSINMSNIETSFEFARNIRLKCLKMVYKARASHIAGALSCADILGVLFHNVLNIDPQNPQKPDRDLFYFSKGHACTALYAALATKGFFPESDLDTFTQEGSLFLSHVSHYIPGVELSAGSLGLTLSHAIGCAIAKKHKKQTARVFCLLSDGELNEGSNWEGFLFAPHHKLDNLTVIVDYNKIQSLDRVESVLVLEPLEEKFRSFGWNCLSIDGHDHSELNRAFNYRSNNIKPTVIIANTIKGKGVDFMEDTVKWHYKSPDEKEYLEAIEQIKQMS